MTGVEGSDLLPDLASADPASADLADAPAHRVQIVHLLASPVHRYEGRPADGIAPAPVDAAGAPVPESRETIEVRAGLGIVGDRFYGRRAHRTAAVTVMAVESLEFVQEALGVASPFDLAAARRNILLRGVDVDALRGEAFSLDSGSGPVLFQGHRPANPCAWMDVVLAEGAHKALRRRGGVRIEPLTSGTLQLGEAVLRTRAAVVREPVLL